MKALVVHLVLSLALVAGSGCSWNKARTAEGGAAAIAGGPVVTTHRVKDIAGKDVDLSAYRGKTLLIVNTASQCGFTPQYGGLQTLHERYEKKGLVVMGFPSNDYGGQEPGSDEAIETFCSAKFKVTFPMFSKVQTDPGQGQAPLYRSLTEETPEGIRGPLKWNFTKFLVNSEGKVVSRFEPAVDPLDERVISAVEANLPK